jgi:hypothetical protein
MCVYCCVLCEKLYHSYVACISAVVVLPCVANRYGTCMTWCCRCSVQLGRPLCLPTLTARTAGCCTCLYAYYCAQLLLYMAIIGHSYIAADLLLEVFDACCQHRMVHSCNASVDGWF